MISAIPTVIPAIVECLYPKSFIRSSIRDVSVTLKRLKTSAMMLPKFFFLNGPIKSCVLINSGMFVPAGTKYLSGVCTAKLKSVGSFK